MFFRRFRTIGLLCVLGASFGTATWAQNPKRARAVALVKHASEVFNTGDIKTASQICREAIRIDPTYPRSYTWLAAVFQKRGDKPNACRNYIQVVRLAPGSSDAARAMRGIRELNCDVPPNLGRRPAPRNNGNKRRAAVGSTESRPLTSRPLYGSNPVESRPFSNVSNSIGSGLARLEKRWVTPKNTGVTSLAFSPNGRFLTGTGANGEWYLWQFGTDTLEQLRPGTPNDSGSVAASSDFYAAGTATGAVRLFDARDGSQARQVGELEGRIGPVYALAYSHGGRYLAAAGTDRALKIFDGRQNQLLRKIQDPQRATYGTTFSPDGRMVAASVGNEARIYSTDKGRLIRTMRGDSLPMTTLSWSRGGSYLAGVNGTHIRVWNPNSGQLIRSLSGGRTGFPTLAFGNGNLLASGGYDGQVRLWNAASGANISTLRLHAVPVRAVAFDATGKRLASGDANGIIGIWRLS